PMPHEIALSCSCPDWASMCKHVAAVLYGIGARLDAQPELLFRLHELDEQELITKASSGLSVSKKPLPSRMLGGANLSELFGLEMAADVAGNRTVVKTAKPKRAKKSRSSSR
ncbi:MAG: SWIM zinc finger family protein, partial [Acidobacteria bacterium]|nr:SWIM zinc finger family protein [Acidobacteriota bacterium]